MINVIHYDIAATIIFIILIFNVYSEHHVESKSNHVLLMLMLVGLMSSVADTASSVLQNSGSHKYAVVLGVYVANYVYFFAHNLLLPIYVFFILTSLDIWHVFTTKYKYVSLWTVAVLLDVFLLITNIFTHKIFYIDKNVQYQRGPQIIVFYVIAALFLINGVFLVLRYRKLVGRAKFHILLLLFPLLMMSVLIQYYTGVQVENFAVAVASLLFIIVIHRNENPVDPDTGALKYYRAIERANVALETRRPFTLVLLKIINNNSIQVYLGRERFYQYLKKQSAQFEELAKTIGCKVDVYYLENGTYGLFLDDKNVDRAIAYANFISRYFEDTYLMDHLEINADVSLCVVKCPDDIEDMGVLTTLATTFYKTVGSSRKVINYADYKDNKDFRIRNELDGIIRKALNEHTFEMYYQPIYSIKQNKYISAEALIRLKDDKYGYIPPDLFISVAEESGAIHEIGDFVLSEVFKFIANNNLEKLGLEYIELNLSASQCIETNLVDKVDRLLKENSITADKIRMELTETAADINPAVVSANVKKLNELGINFALDDYGTGYSNIRRVTSLPFVQVKLDKSFVEEIDNPVMWNVIKDTITMFKEMGKEVLIEGIETEEVAKRFSELKTDLLQGCELMQGFYFCRPMPADRFVMYMQECVDKDRTDNE